MTKRPLQLTAETNLRIVESDLKTYNLLVLNLKLIGEELWICHTEGVTVYDCQWNKLREIRLHEWATSVAALDIKIVVIATHDGLVITSASGTSR